MTCKHISPGRSTICGRDAVKGTDRCELHQPPAWPEPSMCSLCNYDLGLYCKDHKPRPCQTCGGNRYLPGPCPDGRRGCLVIHPVDCPDCERVRDTPDSSTATLRETLLEQIGPDLELRAREEMLEPVYHRHKGINAERARVRKIIEEYVK